MTLTKKISCILTLTLCANLLAFKARALADSPTQSIRTSIDEVILLLKKPEYKNKNTRLGVRKEVESEVRKIFDFSEFSLRTVGKNWSSFSDEQKARFNAAFSDLLLATYLDKINGYNGEKITYSGEILSSSGDRSEVRTLLNLNDGRSIPITYRMLLKNKKWVVYDVIIENISLIKNYRSQFQDLLLKGNPEELIKKIRQRADELRNSSLNSISQ